MLFLFLERPVYSCRFRTGALTSFFDYARPDGRSFGVQREGEDEIDPESLSGLLTMEWDFVERHPDGLQGECNYFYSGDVLHGLEHGMGVRTSKIDRIKYTGHFKQGKR